MGPSVVAGHLLRREFGLEFIVLKLGVGTVVSNCIGVVIAPDPPSDWPGEKGDRVRVL